MQFMHRLFLPLIVLFFAVLHAPAVQASDVLPALEDGTYTIVVLPDTQWYTLSPETIEPDDPGAERLRQHLEHFEHPAQGPEIFRGINQWIVENREAQNIVFVSHVGDLVEQGRGVYADARWLLGREMMDILHGEVPYAIAPGNHDVETSTGDTTLFEAQFGEVRFADFPWYGGSHGNNANSYQKIDAEGDALLFIHLVCNARDDALDWAADVLARYPGRTAIITTHMVLGPVDGRGEGDMGLMEWKKVYRGIGGNTPREMWDKLFSQHANVKLVLSGDQSGSQAWHTTKEGAHGSTVHLLMSDYKQVSKEGYIRLLHITPADEKLEVITYSPTEDKLAEGTAIVPDREYHQFTLPW